MVAELDAHGESTETTTAKQRTEVEVSPSGRRVPIGEAVLLEEQSRRAATFAELRRRPDDAEVRARVRAELDSILAWKTKALRDQFGIERAQVVMRRR